MAWIWQDWFEHTERVLDTAQKHFKAATGRTSKYLHNLVLLHDLGKLRPDTQSWYRKYCSILYEVPKR